MEFPNTFKIIIPLIKRTKKMLEWNFQTGSVENKNECL